jgi:outer membrane protein assembly factor BamA
LLKNEFDDKMNPTRGGKVGLEANLGNKNLISTSLFPAEFYDSLQIQSIQSKFMFSSAFAVSISPILVGYTKIEMATLVSNGNLFSNDLYRLGGLNSLRGFNELEIYSSTYSKIQLEARLLLGENSRLFGFVDWAYSENEVANSSDTFLGLGGGLLVDTPSGVIQLVYAVGKSSKQLLSLAESKIHFGYVARF